MNPKFSAILALLLVCGASTVAERVPWTTSRVKGSPEKPYSYRIDRLFPSQTFSNAVDLLFNRDVQRWFVADQSGKIFTFDTNGSSVHLAADFGAIQGREGAFYAFTFDPNFTSNRSIYVCYALKAEIPDGTHISRFKVKSGAEPELDLATEEILITWLSGGHNGCGLKFGPDGYLYISTGDGAGPNPPDPLHTGQDVSDLLSSLLRIDVHHPGEGRKYSVPSDNPFIGRANTRPEIWAFGFRNPWRFGIDPKNGEIWVGDVGWELWELVYLVQRGGNYGWSIVEGRQPVHTMDAPGPGPILPPIKDHPHSEAASVTGGFVYYGTKFPSLKGAFLYGDWETGKIWAIRAENGKVTYNEELADTSIRVIAFAEDNKGEIVVMDYNGGLYSLEANPTSNSAADFPKTLSETGLFTSVARHEPAPGVVPFQVNASMWNDHATAERFLAVPFSSSITNVERPWRYPSNAVLVRTASLEMERGHPGTRKRIETQILHFNGDNWGAYSYRWNDEQTEASLVPAEGAEAVLKVADASEPGGTRIQLWRFHSRAECLRCHNPWSGTAIGFQPEQLSALEIQRLEASNYFTAANKPLTNSLVSPYDSAEDLNRRARSYLHINCAHCHRDGAGGSVPAFMSIDLPEDKLHLFDARATRGDLGLTHGRVVAPGAPFSSVILFRTSSTGRSRMPYIGTRIVDEDGITLLREWIEKQSPSSHVTSDLLALRSTLARPDADLDRLAARETTSCSDGLRLAHAVTHPSISVSQRERIARAVMRNTNPLIQELFERFLPADSRAPVSQVVAPKQDVLALQGDAARGASLLGDSARLSCLQCHQYRKLGRNFGPEFKKALHNKSRSEILESILEPSRQIAPEYLLYVAETNDEEDPITGIIISRNDSEIVLRDAAAIDHRIPALKMKSLRAQQLSAMPEGLLAGLSAQQVADLLEALAKEGAE